MTFVIILKFSFLFFVLVRGWPKYVAPGCRFSKHTGLSGNNIRQYVRSAVAGILAFLCETIFFYYVKRETCRENNRIRKLDGKLMFYNPSF